MSKQTDNEIDIKSNTNELASQADGDSRADGRSNAEKFSNSFIEIITEEDEEIIPIKMDETETTPGDFDLNVDWNEIEKNANHLRKSSHSSQHGSEHSHSGHSHSGEHASDKSSSASGHSGSEHGDSGHSSKHDSSKNDSSKNDSKKSSKKSSKHKKSERKPKYGSNKNSRHPNSKRPSSRRRHKKKWSKKKKIIVGILIFFGALIVSVLATFFIMRYIGKQALTDYDDLNLTLPEYVDYTDGGNTIYYKGHKYVFNRDIATFLFMGIDNTELKENATMGTAGQADAIYLFTYDISTYKMKVLCLNRDTMCDINRYDVKGNYYDTKKTQLCLAYAFGDGKKTSAENEVTAVRRLIYNIPINAYYAIDLSAIKILNDDIGGVTVTPEYTFSKFQKGVTTTLHGDDAEAFVRTRDVTKVDDNLRRMSCQRLYINGFASGIVPATQEDFTTPFDLYSDSKKYTVSNVDAPKLAFLATDLAFNYSGMEMITTEGKYRMTKRDASAQYILKEQKFFEAVLGIFYNRVD